MSPINQDVLWTLKGFVPDILFNAQTDKSKYGIINNATLFGWVQIWISLDVFITFLGLAN